MNRHSHAAWAAGLALAAVCASPARAEPAAAFGPPLQADRLGQLRGGSVANHNATDGVVRDNSASQITTGANSITDGSFANAAGLPTVIQNSGANVLIQSSTIVNVQFRP